MNVNGITNTNDVSYQYSSGISDDVKQKDVSADQTSSSLTSAKTSEASAKDAINSSGVIYEPSYGSAAISQASTISDAKKLQRDAIISQMKSDSDARTQQLQDIVDQMISKQGSSYATASGDDMWKFLASSDYTVDSSTKAQAQQDVSEDGYYGVNKTSDRIIDFAKTLAGDNTDKLEDMRQAFIKGFKQATKTWGRELPQISQDTYKAVMDKFDKLEGKTSSENDQSASSSGTIADPTVTQS